MKPTIFVANWKMQKKYDQEKKFLQLYTTNLCALAETCQAKLVICPSFVGLPATQKYLSKTPVNYGAQDCSAHINGAYTGEISAQSLAELECSHCIVGHSERRKYHHENDKIVTQKTKQLLENNIIPIICVGESFEEYQQKKTLDILKDQLKPIISLLAQEKNNKTIYIAYEPVWAIGTGKIPKKEELAIVFKNLHTTLSQALSSISIQLLYGGSVNSKNCVELTSIAHVDGFLIGGASLDFQTLKNIVSLVISGKQ